MVKQDLQNSRHCSVTLPHNAAGCKKKKKKELVIWLGIGRWEEKHWHFRYWTAIKSQTSTDKRWNYIMAPCKTIMSDILGPVSFVFCLRGCMSSVVRISKVQLYCRTRKDVIHVEFGSSIIHYILCICLNAFLSGHLNRSGFNYSV